MPDLVRDRVAQDHRQARPELLRQRLGPVGVDAGDDAVAVLRGQGVAELHALAGDPFRHVLGVNAELDHRLAGALGAGGVAVGLGGGGPALFPAGRDAGAPEHVGGLAAGGLEDRVLDARVVIDADRDGGLVGGVRREGGGGREGGQGDGVKGVFGHESRLPCGLRERDSAKSQAQTMARRRPFGEAGLNRQAAETKRVHLRTELDRGDDFG